MHYFLISLEYNNVHPSNQLTCYRTIGRGYRFTAADQRCSLSPRGVGRFQQGVSGIPGVGEDMGTR